MKEATITQITGNGTWESKYGTLYQFEVTFDDDVLLKVNAKTETPPYKVGDKVTYNVTKETQYGKQGKIQKEGQGSYTKSAPMSPDRDAKIIRQTCIKASAELWKEGKWTPQQVVATAEYFVEYCLTGEIQLTTKEDEKLPF